VTHRRLGIWTAAPLLAAVSVVVGCRLADTDGVTPVPQLLAFLPWLLAPTGLGLALALLTRWWTGLVWGVVVLGLVAVPVRLDEPGEQPEHHDTPDEPGPPAGQQGERQGEPGGREQPGQEGEELGYGSDGIGVGRTAPDDGTHPGQQ